MRSKELFAFIKERYNIFIKKEAGKPKPWTRDSILQSRKFCNVYREDDRVTRWIAENWRKPYANNKNMWFAMVVARLVNWPDSLAAITPAVFTPSNIVWKPKKFLTIMDARRKAGEKMYTGAYMIHASREYEATYQYQEAKIYTPMWEARRTFPHKTATTLREIFEWLKNFECMGDFMSAQVIADLKYDPLFSDTFMDDWHTFAAPGPGSMRGLARVYGLDKDYKWKEVDWQQCMIDLKLRIDPMLDKFLGMTRLHMQDLQNCLCEFDKYERVRLGEGGTRSSYPGKEDSITFKNGGSITFSGAKDKLKSML